MSEEISQEDQQFIASLEQIDSRISQQPISEEAMSKQQEIAAPDTAEENRMILTALIEMLKPALPFLGECYSPPVIQQIAYAYTAVEEKRGWNARQYLSVELQLALVTIPPTIGAFFLGREYFRAKIIEDKLPWWAKWMYRLKEKFNRDKRQEEVPDGSHE